MDMKLLLVKTERSNDLYKDRLKCICKRTIEFALRCNWKCDSLKIIFESVYRYPNANDLGQCLKDVLLEASTMCDKLLITGDFNRNDIDWHSYSAIHSDEHIEHVFIECLRDNFLYQQVLEPTRFRENQTCNTLDLVISSEEEDVCNLQITPSLGVSDHATIIFYFICTYKEVQNGSVKMQYSKCNTQGFEDEWEKNDWEERFKDLDLDDMWESFKDQFEESVKKVVPTSIPKPGYKAKPAWMAPEVLSEIKRKRRAWTRYLSTKRNIDFLKYKRVMK